MVYDCFTFFDELDLLEIRLSILEKVVDFFVIVESDHTFSGNKKDYNFRASKSRYRKWQNKIIYLPINQHPKDFDFHKELKEYSQDDGAWQMEFQQRNYLSLANHRFKDEDLILLGDVDEIPDPRVLKNYPVPLCPKVFKMLFHYYYLNCQNFGCERWWNGTIACSGKYFKEVSPQQIRNNRFVYETIENAGWHFSYLGGVERIKNKIQSFAHTEFNNEEFLNQQKLIENITKGKDIFNRPEMHFRFVSIFYYPLFLRLILLRFPNLVHFPLNVNISMNILFKILRFLPKGKLNDKLNTIQSTRLSN